jgi:hypothetical protein
MAVQTRVGPVVLDGSRVRLEPLGADHRRPSGRRRRRARSGGPAAVNCPTIDGRPADGWLSSEKLSLRDALAAYGHGSALGAFAEKRRGAVRVGTEPDIVVLDRDILMGGPSSIIGASAALTVVGGRIVHRSEALP